MVEQRAARVVGVWQVGTGNPQELAEQLAFRLVVPRRVGQAPHPLRCGLFLPGLLFFETVHEEELGFVGFGSRLANGDQRGLVVAPLVS